VLSTPIQSKRTFEQNSKVTIPLEAQVDPYLELANTAVKGAALFGAGAGLFGAAIIALLAFSINQNSVDKAEMRAENKAEMRAENKADRAEMRAENKADKDEIGKKYNLTTGVAVLSLLVTAVSKLNGTQVHKILELLRTLGIQV
jgi:hypothetical protein